MCKCECTRLACSGWRATISISEHTYAPILMVLCAGAQMRVDFKVHRTQSCNLGCDSLKQTQPTTPHSGRHDDDFPRIMTCVNHNQRYFVWDGVHRVHVGIEGQIVHVINMGAHTHAMLLCDIGLGALREPIGRSTCIFYRPFKLRMRFIAVFFTAFYIF